MFKNVKNVTKIKKRKNVFYISIIQLTHTVLVPWAGHF